MSSSPLKFEKTNFFSSDLRPRIHGLGCGGAGCAPLLRLFAQCGFEVSGADVTENEATRRLASEGVRVFLGHAPENLPPDDARELIVLHSSAVKSDNPELVAARKRGARILRRGEALAEFARNYKRVVSVSGSHGKTSVSAMLAHALRTLGVPTGYLVGGAVTGWPESGDTGDPGAADLFVCEVDESDGTHTAISSHLGVIPNVDDDHAWSVGGEAMLHANFQTYATQCKTLLYVGGTVPDRLFSGHPNAIRLSPDVWQGVERHFSAATLAGWGTFQRQNAETVLRVLEELGFGRTESAAALSSFPGVERRMSVRFDNGRVCVVEDYAHHPAELRVSLSSLRLLYPGRPLTVVFQPHRYARLAAYCGEFAEILRACGGNVCVTSVFAAWTESGVVDHTVLAKRIGPANAVAVNGSWREIAKGVSNSLEDGSVVAVIGAGDVKDLLPFLAEELRQKFPIP